MYESLFCCIMVLRMRALAIQSKDKYAYSHFCYQYAGRGVD